MLSRPRHLVGAAAVLTLLPATPAGDSYISERERMVRQQIESRGIRRPDILRVLRLTPRHRFVPEAIQGMAYEDCALPIGYGGTISQPYIVALMTELLSPEKHDRVLEIGTGSGYQAAVLAQLARHVHTMEIVPELANAARTRLAGMGLSNVTVRLGNGYEGWPEQAPFDRIIVTAAPPEIPPVLLEELAPGGRLVAPVGSANFQELVVIEKRLDGSMHRSSAAPVIFVPMRNR